MKVNVVPPDPVWATMYEREARRLREALIDLDVDIHHIGSTAIIGIFAKPTIDILMIVQNIDLLDEFNDKMCMLEYEPKGKFGIAGRRYFRRNSPQSIRMHQVHAFEAESIGARRHLAFRDYMNSHAEAAKAYSLPKQKLAALYANNLQAYNDGKDAFIRKHEALALA